MTDAEFRLRLGRELRRARHGRGETLEVVAARAGMCLGHLSQVETGAGACAVRKLRALARALELSLSQLFAAIEAAQPKEG